MKTASEYARSKVKKSFLAATLNVNPQMANNSSILTITAGLDFVRVYLDNNKSAFANNAIDHTYQEKFCATLGEHNVQKDYRFDTQIVVGGDQDFPRSDHDSFSETSNLSGSSSGNNLVGAQVGLHMFQVIADIKDLSESIYMETSP